ncbi:hypothetical protein B5E58_09135 [Tyzzerella sp. An114]|uniref:hypothetical protein n=1 Tax=Tyzzerella sp. An114 TaxID=1965545 RepID=UPI000B4499C0|nr:hypothetical protein [Tyzzerella sp. An114]OUQ57721.1 hypothetical protein B5E58_09135 [Tyzzerella sp. An114]
MGIVTTDYKNYKDIAEAIRGKTGKTDLLLPSEMAGEISGITGGGESVDYSLFAWKRPSTWIPLPEHDTAKDEIFMVMSVPDEGSFYAFTVNTHFTVSWGDTENTTQSFQANEIAKFEFTVNNVAETYFDNTTGNRQALIIVQAEKGTITNVTLNSDDADHPDYIININEIISYLVTVNNFTWKSLRYTKLISFELYGKIMFTSLRYFLETNTVRNVIIPETNLVTDVRSFYTNNTEFLKLNLENCTELSVNGSNLYYVDFGTINDECNVVINYKGNVRIVSVPEIDIKNKTNLQDYIGQSNIKSVDFKNGSVSNVNNISWFAYNSKMLEDVTPFKVTDCNCANAFTNCSKLLISPIWGTTTNATSLFSGCEKMWKMQELDFSKSTNNTNAFNNCKSLKKVNIVKGSINKSISFSNCTAFTAEELNRIFGYCLADLTGQEPQTITITGAGGASECDVSIAQSKNWTVVR